MSGVWDYWRWAYRTAGDTVPRSRAVFDDLAQEALITVWRTLQKGDPSAVYVTRTARSRVRAVASGREREFGAQEAPGCGQHYRPTEEPLPDTFEPPGAACDVLAGVELAYHRGEIGRVLAELPAEWREYVALRFWGQWTDTEIADATGTRKQLWGNRWARSIRPRLAERLAHLEDAA